MLFDEYSSGVASLSDYELDTRDERHRTAIDGYQHADLPAIGTVRIAPLECQAVSDQGGIVL